MLPCEYPDLGTFVADNWLLCTLIANANGLLKVFGSNGEENSQFNAPQAAKLRCLYDLEGDMLYSIIYVEFYGFLLCFQNSKKEGNDPGNLPQAPGWVVERRAFSYPRIGPFYLSGLFIISA